MAGLFETIGQSAKGTAKAMAYAAIGPDILTAYAAAGALGTTIVDTGKEIAGATKKIAGVGEKQKEALEDLKDNTQKQTTIFTSMRDYLKDIVNTNKQIQRAEQQKKSRKKFLEEEAQSEDKPSTSVLKNTISKVKDSAMSPLGKVLLALGLGTLAWNTILDDETKQEIKDKFSAFIEGLTGINFDEIQGEWNTFKNKLAGATALLLSLTRLTSSGAAQLYTNKPPGTGSKTQSGKKSTVKPPGTVAPTTTTKKTTGTTTTKRITPAQRAAISGMNNYKPIKIPKNASATNKVNAKTGAPVFERPTKTGQKQLINAAGQIVSKSEIIEAVAKQGFKSSILAGAKNIPLFGVAFSLAESGYRGWIGDTEGAWIAAGQLMGAIPSGVTNAGAVGLAALNLARDVFAVSYGKYPTFASVSPDDPMYVNVNDPKVKEFWNEVYNAAYEYVLGETKTVPTKSLADFEKMSQADQLNYLGATNRGVELAEQYGRGTAEYRNALQSYRERVLGAARAYSGEGGGADLRSSTNLMDINNSMAYNVDQDVLDLIPDVYIGTDVDDLWLSP